MGRQFLVLDIETVLDPELPIIDGGDSDRLPAPPHHQVVALGAMWLDEAHVVRRLDVLGAGGTEAEILETFAGIVNTRGPNLITFNGRGFDLPVIANRCLRHGIPLPYYYRSRDVRYRFSPEGHLDLMDFLGDFGASKPARLDVVAKLCGMPGKVGIDGKDVGPMVHAGRLAEVEAYCLCDVVQTAGVFLRVQLLRGELEVAAYREAMSALLTAVDGDPRVAAVAAAMDRARLLMQ